MIWHRLPGASGDPRGDRCCTLLRKANKKYETDVETRRELTPTHLFGAACEVTSVDR